MTQRNVMDAAAEAAFETELVALIPHMRAFARSLAGDAAAGDDLAQDALIKAWRNRASFEPGTNLKAWVFVIVRNTFYTDRRRAWRSTSLDPEVAERTLLANDAPDSTLELQDLRRALALIHPLQREAIILVGAGGLAYEEAALVCGCPVGTVKSRVSRARIALATLLEDKDLGDRDAPRNDAVDSLMAELEQLQTRPVTA